MRIKILLHFEKKGQLQDLQEEKFPFIKQKEKKM